MRSARNLRLSVRALAAHRLRAGLAIAGTAAGTAGVAVLLAVGAGARAEVIRRIEGLGRNVLVVTAARVEPRAGRLRQGVEWSKDLRVEDAAAIVRASDAIVRAAPAQDRGSTAKYRRISTPVTVLGTTSDWRRIRQFNLAQGRFLTEQDAQAVAQVAVLGAEVRSALFADTIDPVGRTIRIGRVPFQVVGVLEAKGVSVDGTSSEDDRIIVPLATALRRLFDVDYLKTIYVEATAAAELGRAEADVSAILRARHDLPAGAPDDFAIQNQRALLETELAARAGFQRLIAGLGLLSLVVAGVGILSIMLLSVRERRAEIGVRVAVGARRIDIVVQFLAEAVLIAAAGGALGVGLGIGAAAIVSATTTWQVAVSGAVAALAAGAALTAGTVFGVLPALQAASVQVVEALAAE